MEEVGHIEVCSDLNNSLSGPASTVFELYIFQNNMSLYPTNILHKCNTSPFLVYRTQAKLKTTPTLNNVLIQMTPAKLLFSTT